MIKAETRAVARVFLSPQHSPLPSSDNHTNDAANADYATVTAHLKQTIATMIEEMRK